jgi:hypothetical protein
MHVVIMDLIKLWIRLFLISIHSIKGTEQVESYGMLLETILNFTITWMEICTIIRTLNGGIHHLRCLFISLNFMLIYLKSCFEFHMFMLQCQLDNSFIFLHLPLCHINTNIPCLFLNRICTLWSIFKVYVALWGRWLLALVSPKISQRYPRSK